MRTVSAVVIASFVSFAAAGSVYVPPEAPVPAYAAPSNAAYPVDNGNQDWEHKDEGDKKEGNDWEKVPAAPAYTVPPSYTAPANEGWENKNKTEDWDHKDEGDKKDNNTWGDHKEEAKTTNTWEHKQESKTNEWDHKQESKTNEWEHKQESKTNEWEHKPETKTAEQWNNNKGWEKATTTTKIVSQYTTYCPEPTVVTVNEKQYTVTKATTLTITDCPCTIVEPCPTETANPPPPPPHTETKVVPPPPHTETKAPPAPPAPTGPPKPPPVIVSGASSSFVHVGAAVFGALIVGVLAL